jgi:hypothetical protein
MKKAIVIITVIILLLVLLLPAQYALNDGGTVIYKAILYEVQDVKRLNEAYFEAGGQSGSMYIEGTIIKILGFEIYNNVEE